MNRRNFIKNTALALPAFSLAGFLLSSCNKGTDANPSKAKKIGIIGAGIAGLHAARPLFEQGYEIEILEAGDRIGGRIQSEEHLFGSFNVELGANAAFGSDNEWFRMMSRKSSPFIINENTASTYYIDGISHNSADHTFDQELNLMQQRLNEMKNYQSGSDISVEEYMIAQGVPEKVRFIFRGISEELVGTTVNNASVKLNSNEGLSKINETRYLPGSESFKKVLLREYASILPNVLTNTPVASINYSDDKVRVTDNLQRQYIYDAIIVTVPLSILKLKENQANAIRFTPALPQSKLDAMELLGMDSGVRVILNVNKRFWHPDSKVVYTNGSIGKFEVIKEDLLSNRFVLSALVTGDVASNNYDMKSEAEIIQLIKSELTASIGSSAAVAITDYKIKHWSKDPFIKGTFSYHKVGGSSDTRSELARQVSGKLFFAGEACNSKGQSGTISGAMDTAISAVKEIRTLIA